MTGSMPRIVCAALLAGCAFAARAGGGLTVPAPPNIILQPRPPVLDENCVRKIKKQLPAATQAQLVHACRKAYEPGPQGDARLIVPGQRRPPPSP
jgi:entry exclusion lipoprotein TrbK